jgi:hypothetical protein
MQRPRPGAGRGRRGRRRRGSLTATRTAAAEAARRPPRPRPRLSAAAEPALACLSEAPSHSGWQVRLLEHAVTVPVSGWHPGRNFKLPVTEY